MLQIGAARGTSSVTYFPPSLLFQVPVCLMRFLSLKVSNRLAAVSADKQTAADTAALSRHTSTGAATFAFIQAWPSPKRMRTHD